MQSSNSNLGTIRGQARSLMGLENSPHPQAPASALSIAGERSGSRALQDRAYAEPDLVPWLFAQARSKVKGR